MIRATEARLKYGLSVIVFGSDERGNELVAFASFESLNSGQLRLLPNRDKSQIKLLLHSAERCAPLQCQQLSEAPAKLVRGSHRYLGPAT